MNPKRKALLSSAQQQVVLQTQGPVLVIAGPGSGKTHTLMHRIAYMIEEQGIAPQEILCLTFTDSAALEMQERLSRLIGEVAASEVSLLTYHAFALRESKRWTSEGLIDGRELTQLDDVSHAHLMKELILKGSYREIRPLHQPLSRFSDLSGALSTLKKEGISPEDFTRIVSESEASLDPDSLTPKQHRDAKKQHDLWSELADLYGRYESTLEERSLQDYDDMIYDFLRLLEERSDLRSDLQERYQYLMSDEFQDSNGSQLQILSLISETSDSQPNLCIVGDDDQGIYRFQGANTQNIVLFLQRYPQASVLPLTENYRSTPEIVSFAQEIIGQSTSRLLSSDEKSLSSMRPSSGQLPQVQEFESLQHQDHALVEQLRELHAQGHSYRDMAILVTTNSQVRSYGVLLRSQGIPISHDASEPVLEDPLIQGIVALLELMYQPRQRRPLGMVIAQPWFPGSPQERGEILRSLSQLRAEDFPEVIRSLSSSGLLTDETLERLEAWYADLLAAPSDFTRLPLLEAFLKVLERFGVMTWLESGSSPPESYYALSRFRHEILRIQQSDPHAALQAILSALSVREDLSLPLHHQPYMIHRDAVQIMTAHKSKGMEFPIVFLPRLHAQNWEKSASRGITLPGGILPLHEEGDARKLSHMEERRRLLYVACTRARDQLFCLFPQRLQKKEVLLTPSVHHVLSLPSSSVEHVLREASESDTVSSFQAELRPLTPASQTHRDFLRSSSLLVSRLAASGEISFSPSSYLDYAVCPYAFLMGRIYRIPEPTNMTFLRGTALHGALEYLVQKHISEGLPVTDQSLGRGVITQSLQDTPGLTPTTREQLISETQEILGEYLDSNPVALTSPHEVERWIQSTLPGGARIEGKIDLIRHSSTGLEVVDYKSGRPQTLEYIWGTQTPGVGIPVLDPTGQKGRTGLQLLFYALLLSCEGMTVDSLRTEYLRPQKSGRFTERVIPHPGEEVLRELQSDIEQAWETLLSEKAFVGLGPCSRTECSFCAKAPW